jgi:hypothetical protein
MKKRIDVHSPSKRDNGDYEYAGVIYQGFSEEIEEMYSYDPDYVDGMEIVFEQGPLFNGNFVRNNTCDHCGHVFCHGAVYLHKPTKEYVVVGHICANDYFSSDAAARFQKKQRNIAAALRNRKRNITKLLRKKARLRRFVEENPLVVAAFKSEHKEDRIVKELRSNLNYYGNLTPKQKEFLVRIASKPFVVEIKAPVLEGKIEVSGEVLGFKQVENNFSYYNDTITKMVFKDDRGFTLFGTVPAAFKGRSETKESIERGDRIKFTATIQKSQRDETFGFFKRATKCEVLNDTK